MGPNRRTGHYESTRRGFCAAKPSEIYRELSSFVLLFGLVAWQAVRSRKIGGRWFVPTAVIRLECANSPEPDSAEAGFSLPNFFGNLFCFPTQEE